jgi:hypothetical protein
MDLSAMELLTLNVKIPSFQRTPTQLLVVLRDADGGEYLAHTGHTLGGRDQGEFVKIYVPKTSFLLAGWSKDPNAKMDLDKIRNYGSAGAATSARKARRWSFPCRIFRF